MTEKIGTERELLFLLDKIKRNRNIDFSMYRRAVLQRRIHSRMHQTGCANYWDYIVLLNKEPCEYDKLIESLTIKVSEFFRDPDVFELLGQVVIPEIILEKQERGVRRIRAWSCGTALGQEAYSMAILFCESLGRKLGEFDVEILATDIDRDVLEKAPWASYDKSEVRKISPPLLFKYFTMVGDRYVVSDTARSLVSFKYHDIVSGNTMQQMDLVLCKNLFIYFEEELQVRALNKFCKAMNTGAFLVLGSTETVAPPMRGCFEVADISGRIYRKK